MKKTILILIVCIPLLLLTACEDADWVMVEKAFNAWLEKNDIYVDEELQPEALVIKAVEDTIGDMTNKDPFIQLDALENVIPEIDKADKLANEAMILMDKGKMEEAIELRPKDWRLREQMAVINTSETKVGISTENFEESTELIKELIDQGGDCITLRKQQLEYRETLLSDTLINCDDIFECNEHYLAQELELVQENLAEINAGIKPAMCIGK